MDDTSLNTHNDEFDAFEPDNEESLSQQLKSLNDIDNIAKDNHGSSNNEKQNNETHREKQSEPADNVDIYEVFGDAITQALTPSDPPEIPLAENEVIDEDEPTHINITALICTIIIAICATIIICVAKPWKNDATEEPVITASTETTEVTSEKNNAKPAEEQTSTATTTPVQEPAKPIESKAKASTLPVIRVVTTGDNNIYNNIRLIDASSRLLTQEEVEQMTKDELALARNAIYARHGYRFKNAELGKFFSMQPWFKGTDVTIEQVNKTSIEVANINIIKAQEKKL